MGTFQPFHVLEYEAVLADGKVPDFRIVLQTGHSVYVECKSQSFSNTERERSLTRATDRLQRTLDPDRSTFVNAAWSMGLRTEVRLSKSPTEHEFGDFENRLNRCSPNADPIPNVFGASISVNAVPRDQPFDDPVPTRRQWHGSERWQCSFITGIATPRFIRGRDSKRNSDVLNEIYFVPPGAN